MSHPKLAALSAQLDSSPKAAELRLLAILDFVREPLDDLIDSIGVDAVIAQLQALYDQYAAPIDIPWVPNVLEPTLIDMPAKQLIAAVVRRLHDKIHTP